MNSILLGLVVIPLIKYLVVVAIVMTIVAWSTWAERKILGFMQARIGPNRAGPIGLLQPIADGIKLITKEDIIPSRSEKFLHLLGPILVFVPALMLFSVIPFGGESTIFGLLKEPVTLYVTDVNIGMILVLALSSLGIYGLILGGWASNNKYSLMGGLRSAAQMVSYEIPQGFAIVAVLILAGSLSLVRIVEAQAESGMWFIFPGFIAFFIFFVCAVAETNRTPFDLPEAESELVAGYHTEYSGMKFALFFMAEYANMVLVSSIGTVLFLGGWLPPFPSVTRGTMIDLPLFWFFAKVAVFLFLLIWFRATFPRYRFDQLMALGWKWLLPLAILNVIALAMLKLWVFA
ncbi:MAG TPA: NADH-quinone oxidoreductase subunit NuoH [Thermoanaerobaculia bacterium]|nr:NADH-quinone oxidoreductase subunit NuoH [Thermoanaerobaculia bacterium]HUM29549.1 NADH-quinone oxidoreductase subunit NuoH [Thermoanaerobaculia bacterium]HXK67932.1 NADH-quinone oxidoreductase subunit NuoH [Thermoanaerobaculia bacterium]